MPVEYKGTRMDAPVVVSSDQAHQMAVRELAKSKYHTGPATGPPQQLPSVGASPPPPPHQTSSVGHAGMIVLVILAAIVLVLAIVLLLRRLGRPRTQKKSKKPTKSSAGAAATQEPLVGAARHRRAAEVAADAGDWAEAIRERFRAVIATLDERGLLPERVDRTADEAAHDAGALLPAHASVLTAAARAFDDVEYGEFVGTAEGYRLISEVDGLVSAARPESLAAAGGAR
jgi:Domain of unknown function (DUF4129)